MATIDEQSAQVKRITDNIEESFQNLRKIARNLSTLLIVGRATCDEIKAYNLYALAIYDSQRAMLTHLRANGVTDAPELPPSPTLFGWKGVSGENAFRIDCTGQATSLSDALSQAFASAAQPNAVFVGSDQIRIVTQDPNVFFPERDMPSLDEITKQAATAGLGVAPMVIVLIAGLTLGLVAYAVSALAALLKEKNIQEQTTVRANVQLKAFEAYSTARMSCYDSCIGKGNTVDACVKTCKTLVDKPKIDVTPRSGLPPADDSFGLFAKVGLVTLAGLGGLIIFKMHKRGMFDRFKSGGDAAVAQHALPDAS